MFERVQTLFIALVRVKSVRTIRMKTNYILSLSKRIVRTQLKRFEHRFFRANLERIDNLERSFGLKRLVSKKKKKKLGNQENFIPKEISGQGYWYDLRVRKNSDQN